METGTLGSRQQVQLGAVSTDARMAVEAAGARLRGLAHELRAAYGEVVAEAAETEQGQALQPDPRQLAPARALVEQLEHAIGKLREVSEALGVPALTDPTGTDRAGVDRGRAGEPASPAALLDAREEERTWLAEELHDGTAQALANALFQTEILGQAMRSQPAAAEAELMSLRGLLQRELDRLRAYINELRPPLMESGGLEDALRDRAAELAARTGIDVDVRLDAPSSALDEPERAVALRVAQEAMRNVGKHANASRAWVATRHANSDGQAGAWILEVGDDGRGFDLDEAAGSANRRHFGLRFMRQRAQLVGAELTIDTRPAAGTVVRLAIRKAGERS